MSFEKFDFDNKKVTEMTEEELTAHNEAVIANLTEQLTPSDKSDVETGSVSLPAELNPGTPRFSPQNEPRKESDEPPQWNGPEKVDQKPPQKTL